MSSEPSPGIEALRRAEGLLDNRDLEGALESVNQALRSDEQLGEAWVLAGLVNRRLGRFSEALRCLTAAKNILPGDGEVLLNIGLTHERTGDLAAATEAFDDAVRALESLCDLKPKDECLLNDLGVALRRLDSVRKRAGIVTATDTDVLSRAKECFQKACELNTRYAEAWNNFGLVTLELTRSYAEPWTESSVSEAVAHFKKAISCDSSLKEPWNNLGEVYEKLGELGEAEHYLRWAVWMDPKDECAWNNLGLLYKRMDQREKARGCFIAATNLNQEYAEALDNLGSMFFEDGHLQQAREMLTRAIKADRTLAEAWTSLGAVYGKLGDLDQATACLQNALKLTNDRDPSAWNDLGITLLRQNRHNEALSCFSKALAIDESDAELWNNIGEVYMVVGLFDKAADHFDKACLLKGKNPIYWRNAAKAAEAQGHTDQARMHLDHARSLEG